MVPELGIIEGYFGNPWSHAERKHVATGARRLGFSFFHYAPKADHFLRRRWRERHPDAATAGLAALSVHCRSLGMRFGIGLSPFELYRDYSGAAKADFLAKVRALDEIGLDDLAILFDDTRGDVPDLPAKEADIVHAAMAATRATRVVTCPTYYSDDRVLDGLFGERPAGYLEELGRRLDPRVGVYWTGEEVCSREYRPGHLDRVARFRARHQSRAPAAPHPDPGRHAGRELPRRHRVLLHARLPRGIAGSRRPGSRGLARGRPAGPGWTGPTRRIAGSRNASSANSRETGRGHPRPAFLVPPA
ncbi:MAG: beta-N-acetylglucosaminidase domain-containing protein [Burkholderiales bacterium]